MMTDPAHPLVINLALTGMVPRRADNPALPVSPEEIALDVKRCFQLGARTFHIHARAENEAPTYQKEIFADIIRRIRREVAQAIICVSTSGRVHKTFEERGDVLDLEGDVKPDLASLTLGSLNFPKHASVNDPEMIRRLAICMAERGIVPELEIFDFGMLDYAHYLIGKGVLKQPFVFNLLLGSLGTLAATGVNLSLLVERLPAGAFWSAAGIGRFQFGMNALGTVLGGHVRVGLEDTLYLDVARQEPATNPKLVQRIAGVAQALGRPMATPEQARRLIGLPT
jgi:3-keto-5-aminohexanoate cleavage enzyme